MAFRRLLLASVYYIKTSVFIIKLNSNPFYALHRIYILHKSCKFYHFLRFFLLSCKVIDNFDNSANKSTSIAYFKWNVPLTIRSLIKRCVKYDTFLKKVF